MIKNIWKNFSRSFVDKKINAKAVPWYIRRVKSFLLKANGTESGLETKYHMITRPDPFSVLKIYPIILSLLPY